MLWSSLGQFWKELIKIKQLKVLMPVSPTPKGSGPLNTWYIENFIPILRAVQKLRFTLCHNIFYLTNMPWLCKFWNYIG